MDFIFISERKLQPKSKHFVTQKKPFPGCLDRQDIFSLFWRNAVIICAIKKRECTKRTLLEFLTVIFFSSSEGTLHFF